MSAIDWVLLLGVPAAALVAGFGLGRRWTLNGPHAAKPYPVTSGKGAVLVDELILPVVDIYLDDGEINLVAELRGPVRAFASDSYAVTDRSGAVVYRSAGKPGRIDFSETKEGDTVRFIAHLSLEGRTSWPARGHA